MKNLSLLLTLDQQEDEYNTYLLDYHSGASLGRDRWGTPRLLARQSSACGWQAGGIPLLIGRGPAPTGVEFLPARQGARLSTDGRWLWKPHPQAPWPAPQRVVQIDRQLMRTEVIWKKEGWEVLDLQVDTDGQGLYFAVRCPGGCGQLWHWCPHRRTHQLLLDNADFHPIEFTVHPSRSGLAFVDQNDDQVYYYPFGGSGIRCLSQPRREQECQGSRGVYRCSPAFSPDGNRLFYCTAFLEMEGGSLCNSGNLYVTSMLEDKLRLVSLGDEGCPINLCLPSWPVYSAMAIAS
ncbi:MAG: hypothetical protein KF760_08660 [Candidatus Eremiobacteraeota bacterium]|nr:hypothetical protein [Candidatus Eremiobacteraeota bacterium]MCW5870703.1 hypothetical protein [Candidatus Eremiobacteraeota bacterium]